MNDSLRDTDRDLWLENRKRYIGGSDAAAIMGVSPWATPVELWMQKTGQLSPPPVDPARERMFARGKRLEPIIVEMAIDKLRGQGHTVELVARNQRYVDPEFPFLSAEIDMELMIDGELVNGDAKSVHGFARRKWGEEETEDIPIEYAAQFMHGLMVTPGNRQRCVVAALIGLDDVAIYWLNRDDETIAAMRAKEVAFWNDCVLGGAMPDPIVFNDIKALFPRDNGAAIEATADIAEKVKQLADIKARIKSLEDAEEALKFEIADFISPNARLTFHGRELASWKAQLTRRLDSKALATAHPAIAEAFTVSTDVRVLRLKKEKS